MIPMLKASDVEAFINNNKTNGCGTAATFWNMNGVGVKQYRSLYTAAKSYLLQRYLSQFGVAPYVGQFFPELNAYTTEVVKVLSTTTSRVEERWYRGLSNRWGKRLKRKLEHTGIYGLNNDLHVGNVGFRGSTLLLLDVDNCWVENPQISLALRAWHNC